MKVEEKNIEMVPIRDIRVLNPRARNKKRFKQIVENIANVGLKKPITVSKRKSVKPGGPKYDLACGQGRLEAFEALGYDEIPAIVKSLTKEERLLISLVENLARRSQTTLEQVKEVIALKNRGYKTGEIARKIDRSKAYVTGIIGLFQKGEERLIEAVEKGRVPLNVAMTIAKSADEDIQRFLTEAYEDQKLKGRALMTARQVVEQRRNHGKKLTRIRGKKKITSADALVREYQKEAKWKQHRIDTAQLCGARLMFLTSAFQKLLSDENFTTLLRAEDLNTLPKNLADELQREEVI